MAAPWRLADKVNNSGYVAPRPLLRLAAQRLTGHSVQDHALDDRESRAKRTFQARPAGSRPATALILEELPMSDAVKVGFVPFSTAHRGTLVVFCDDALKFGAATRKTLGRAANLVRRAADTNQFKGKSGLTLDILAPEGLKASRLIVAGAGELSAIKDNDFLKLGGVAAGKLRAGNGPVTVVAELPTGAMTPDQAAAVASGIRLRAYKFDRYKTRKKDGEEAALSADVSLAVDDVAAARKAFAPDAHISAAVIVARELGNQPPHVLYPSEFARRARPLKKLGVDVEVLDLKATTKLGIGALLGVAQGSTRAGRTVIMRWNGAK